MQFLTLISPSVDRKPKRTRAFIHEQAVRKCLPLLYAEKRERNLSLYDLLIPMPMSLTTAALLMLRKSFELNVSPAQYSFKRNYSGTFRFVR